MVESAPVRLQRTYARLLAYHFYRSGVAATNASKAMEPIYGKHFANFKFFKRMNATFRKANFTFASLFEPEKKSVPKNVPRPLPPPMPSDDEDGETVAVVEKEIPQEEEEEAVEMSENQVEVILETDEKPQEGEESRDIDDNSCPSADEAPNNDHHDTSDDDSTAEQSDTQPEDAKSSSSELKLSKKQNRKLILDCFKAKYTLRETQRSLRAAYGSAVFGSKVIAKWYHRFEENNLSLNSKPITGRPPKVDTGAILAAVQANPAVRTKVLSAELGFSCETVKRWMNKLGYQYLIDTWVKVDDGHTGLLKKTRRAQVSDEELKAYKDEHPQATIADLALHFKIPRIKLADRLRSLGFYLPKWPKRKPSVPGRKPGRPKRDPNEKTPDTPEITKEALIRKIRKQPLRTAEDLLSQAVASGPSKSKGANLGTNSANLGSTTANSGSTTSTTSTTSDLLQVAIQTSHLLSPHPSAGVGASGTVGPSGPLGLSSSEALPNFNSSNCNLLPATLRRKLSGHSIHPPLPATTTYQINSSQAFPMYHFPAASTSQSDPMVHQMDQSQTANNYLSLGNSAYQSLADQAFDSSLLDLFNLNVVPASDNQPQQQQQQSSSSSQTLQSLLGPYY